MIVVPQFEPVGHRYVVDGEELASVTTVLKALGLYPPFADGPYRERGTAVHLATEYDDLGELDDERTHPAILPYVEAWRQCRAALGLRFQLDQIEVRLANPDQRIAGTLDRLTDDAIYDLKTGAPPPCTALQLAAYAHLAELRDGRPRRRYSVWLRPDMEPRYKVCEYDDPNDFIVWDSCRVIYTSESARALWPALVGVRELTYDDLLSCLALWTWKRKKE